MASWYPLTYVLNNLNRGLGLPDGYPFVLSAPAVEKLRFVHEMSLRGDRSPTCPGRRTGRRPVPTKTDPKRRPMEDGPHVTGSTGVTSTDTFTSCRPPPRITPLSGLTSS